MIVCRSAAELERLARVNELVARVLAELKAYVAPGVTTADLDALAEQRLAEAGAEPAFKGYHGYPATICASVNEQVVHGIPSKRKLVDGDIVSIDMGAKLDGFFGDSAVTVPVGSIDSNAARLLEVTEAALYKGIQVVKSGARVSDIGAAVQAHVEANGFSVVREFVGHGIGTRLHEEPQIPNYGTAGRGPRLSEGMVLAIEPMVNFGKPAVKVLGDGWTAVTKDGSLSAHFEHTVVVVNGGCRILTREEVDSADGHPSADAAPGTPAAESNDRHRTPSVVGPIFGSAGAINSQAAVEAIAEGVVAELLPSQLAKVDLDGRHHVIAHLGDPVHRNYIRVLVGDRVKVALMPADRTRGRIVEKL